MKFFKIILTFLILISPILIYSQDKFESKKVKITGKIVEKTSNQPLEYATVTLINTKNSKAIFGGITNNLGEFSIDANAGLYDLKIEFISFNPLIIKQQKLLEDTNLGNILMFENPSQLGEVVVRAESSTVEIKLDKKVYNVGKDMVVKGGTATDVLNNVPSVTVDGDGNVSLRGNENVKIFIDGRPTTATNIASALQQISADAVDKIEVISNPSARYDAEGGAGILNIILKKGKSDGINGTITATLGNPKNAGLVSSFNYKTELFNFYAGFGYNDSKSPGNAKTNSDYLNPNRTIERSINQVSKQERGRKGIGYNFGIDLNIDKSTIWTNAINVRTNEGDNPDNVFISNYLPTGNFVRNRYNNQFTSVRDVDFTTSFIKKFKKDGHKLTINGTFGNDLDKDNSTISDLIIGQENLVTKEATKNIQSESRNLLQADYVLPFGKSNQFEMGYKGDFNGLLTNFAVGNLDNYGNYTPNLALTNIFDYKEKINAGYIQIGSKFKKLSFLLGMRFEDSKININLLTTNEFNSKHYQNWFPSAFLTYPISDITSISLNYSKRITRPRNRFINPFAGFASNINIFQGNPDINPSTTDVLDFGVLTKIKKVTFTSSIYYNNSKNPFLFTRRENGNVVNGTKVLLSTPINLETEQRFGIEFTANFSPIKWWKLNTNFNFFQSKLYGNNTYTLLNSNVLVVNYLEKKSTNWFLKLNSKISLPYKIDWQTNGIYTAPQDTPQGKSLSVYTINLAFSKDILKDKATISLNVSDLFNSTKMFRQFNLPTVNSYTEMQRRERQINLNFTYRFNKKKEEKPNRPKQEESGGDF